MCIYIYIYIKREKQIYINIDLDIYIYIPSLSLSLSLSFSASFSLSLSLSLSLLVKCFFSESKFLPFLMRVFFSLRTFTLLKLSHSPLHRSSRPDFFVVPLERHFFLMMITLGVVFIKSLVCAKLFPGRLRSGSLAAAKYLAQQKQMKWK